MDEYTVKNTGGCHDSYRYQEEEKKQNKKNQSNDYGKRWNRKECRIGQAKMAFLENKELLRSDINITVKKKIIET